MRRGFFAVLVSTCVLFPTLIHAQSLDTPGNGSFVSGIGYIRGWKCTAGSLTFTIDNGPPASLSYGAERGDTQGVCGDVNNGYVAQFNWNLLSNGQHTIRVFDNGVQFAQSTFTSTNLGSEFLTGQSATCNTGIAGKDVTLTWQQDQQNFVITGASGGGSYPNVVGTYSTSMDFVAEDCNFLSVPPDLPLHVSGTLKVSQNGANLSVLSGSVTFTGSLETDGDFTITAPPAPNTTVGCTYAFLAGYAGNFNDGSLILLIQVAYVSGNCTGLSLPCSVLYAGSMSKISGSAQVLGEPDIDDVLQALRAAAAK